MASERILLIGSFALSLSILVFGSQFIIKSFDLFPADPSGPPTSFRNVLHNAWGSSSSSPISKASNLFSKLMAQKSTGDSPFDIQNLIMPMGFAVLLGLGAIVSVFVFGKSKKKPVLDPAVWKDFTLIHKTAISHNTAIYRFGLPSPNDILGLPIGQHIAIQAEIGGKQIVRSYTPTSSDDDLGHFDLMVKSYEKGNISRYLSLLSVGQKIRVKGPRGQFNYRAGLSSHLGMIAGGTGITPMLQIIRAILKNPHDHTQLSLIYANVTFDDILLKEELDNLAELHPEKFTVYYVLNEAPTNGWDGGVGFISKDMISHHMPSPKEDIKVLMCGPPPMMSAMKKHIAELGYDEPRAVSKLADQIFVF